jgi:uncharacterized protein YbjT (DUF2867 family)
MSQRIFVTGAGGTVGSRVAEELIKRGCEVVAGHRQPPAAAAHAALKPMRFDFADPSTWDACLRGVHGVFLMRPPHISNIRRDMLPFMKRMQELGIRRVVFLSVQGAESNRIIPHHKAERLLAELGFEYSFLRPSFFMQNLTTTHLAEIRDERELFIPAGSGRTNFVDAEDIGEVAALMFGDSRHIGRAYTVTGERSWSYGEVAEALSEGLGRRISYENPGPFKFIIRHVRRGRPVAMTLVMLALYAAVKSGSADITTGDCAELLVRRPGTLEEFIARNRVLFGARA